MFDLMFCFQGGNSFVLLGNGDIFVTGGKTEDDQRLEPGVRTYIYRDVLLSIQNAV